MQSPNIELKSVSELHQCDPQNKHQGKGGQKGTCLSRADLGSIPRILLTSWIPQGIIPEGRIMNNIWASEGVAQKKETKT